MKQLYCCFHSNSRLELGPHLTALSSGCKLEILESQVQCCSNPQIWHLLAWLLVCSECDHMQSHHLSSPGGTKQTEQQSWKPTFSSQKSSHIFAAETHVLHKLNYMYKKNVLDRLMLYLHTATDALFLCHTHSDRTVRIVWCEMCLQGSSSVSSLCSCIGSMAVWVLCAEDIPQ